MTAAHSTETAPQKLPLWRLILGIAVLGAMVTVLLSLAPVYLENYRLQQYLTQLARDPGFAATPDDALRREVQAKATALLLPLRLSDIQITRAEGGLKLQMAYAVGMNLGLYRVDLHFHPGVTAGPPHPAQ